MRRFMVSAAVLVAAGSLVAWGVARGNGIPIWLGSGLLICGVGVLALSWLSGRGPDF